MSAKDYYHAGGQQNYPPPGLSLVLVMVVFVLHSRCDRATRWLLPSTATTGVPASIRPATARTGLSAPGGPSDSLRVCTHVFLRVSSTYMRAINQSTSPTAEVGLKRRDHGLSSRCLSLLLCGRYVRPIFLEGYRLIMDDHRIVRLYILK